METVEELLKRGGKISKIPQGVSGEWRFNGPLKDRINAQKKATWNARSEHLRKQGKR